MPPPLIVDLNTIDLDNLAFSVEDIERINPHRYQMRLLDGIVWHDPDTSSVVGFKDVRDDEFWVPGHIPQRPLLPGVLMLESAAQLASFYAKLTFFKNDKFLGLGGIENAKFRGTVLPGQRLYLLGTLTEKRPRRVTCAAQGVVDGQMVFQADIIGMPV